jgi:hypothetical protein
MNGSNHNLKTGIKECRQKNTNFSYNAFSDWGIIKHGVPQGSVLGLLLFLST